VHNRPHERQKTLLLVDGSSYLYRALHAMRRPAPRRGDQQPATGAIRGMVNMMQALAGKVQADYAACVFDAKGPTATRSTLLQAAAHMPDDLRAQIAPIHEVVRLLGWKVVDVPGVEADDVIGTLAVTAGGARASR
jgi:DNA polymerase-1